MKCEELSIGGMWLMTPTHHVDDRGVFLEWFRSDTLVEHLGHGLPLAQANLSTSRKGVVRGIHFADVPPGQAKYITCVRGAVQDVVVDLRDGSPTFGRWEAVTLDDGQRRGLYISEGLGHGFCALTDEATVVYLTSSPYNSKVERNIDPLDADLGIDWMSDDPVLSARDAAAQSVAATSRAGLLPDYARCVQRAAGASTALRTAR